MLFCRKTDETVWKPPPLAPHSTNPRISEQFFHDPPLCPNFKIQKPNFRGGGGNYVVVYHLFPMFLREKEKILGYRNLSSNIKRILRN